MRISGTCTGAVSASLLMIVMSVRATVGIRSLVRGTHARDLALGSNALQSVQSMWQRDSQESEPPHVHDPKDTFRQFLRNSERQKARRRQIKKNKRKNQIPMPRVGPPGPPGPRGPPGPAGEAGGVLTTGEMEAYITDFLREFFQQHNDTVHISDSLERAEKTRRSRINVAFTAQLPHPATLRPSVLSVVDTFTVTFAPGAFERRVVVEHGGFTVTKSGIYQVAASLLLHPRGPSHSALKPLKDIRVYICVTVCDRDSRRLEWVGNVGEGSVTAVLSGHIALRRGDTLMVAVDNLSRRSLQVGTGSSFSAAFIGT
ncbi:adipolin-like [Penaeus japonicus]|uniref:adipolin-like n=1 Tax=Penaeus japonicus TaxID=27405 RepID=UPI001C710C0B|nr:adipolin-like [Penaeus japonicus]